ncbi:MAG: trypsin-like peptidase domain-containing protein [Pirellulales bacterium]
MTNQSATTSSWFATLIAGLWLAATSTGQEAASVPDGPAAVMAIESVLVDVIARAEQSVVAISRSAPVPVPANRAPAVIEFGRDPFERIRNNAAQPLPHASGAGVIIDPAGLILTQYLVVHAGDVHTVSTVDGKTYAAEIRGADPHSGLAVLAVKASDLPAIAMGDATSLRKGQMVVSLSNPHVIQSDGQPTASWGIVSNLARKAAPHDNFNNVNDPTGTFRSSIHHFGTLIQTDARLGWGASGGALINMRGELIGVTSAVDTISGHEAAAGYAIPMNAPMRRIIDDLKQGREVEYGLLGISFNADATAPTSTGDQGVIVTQVILGSPAARAGIQANDVITHVGDQPVPDPDRLQLVVRNLSPSERAPIRFERQGSPQQTEVIAGKYHVAGEKVITENPVSWRGIRVDHSTAIPAFQLQQSAQLGEIDPEGCVVVSEVAEESPAWSAGVRPGMFISHVGEHRVATPDEFHKAVESAAGPVSLRFVQSARQTEGEAVREIPANP